MRKQHTPTVSTANPLTRLLERAAQQTTDPRVRRWLEALRKGESASGGSGLPAERRETERVET